jgi:hypothetical protein
MKFPFIGLQVNRINWLIYLNFDIYMLTLYSFLRQKNLNFQILASRFQMMKLKWNNNVIQATLTQYKSIRN